MFSELVYKLFFADDAAYLRAAEQFVAGECDDVASGLERLGDRRVVFARKARRGKVDEHPAAEVLHKYKAAAVRQSRELFARHGGVEARDAVVRWVDLQQHRTFFGYRGLVVAQVCAVRSADLDHLRAGERHDVRDAEGAAYLDQFSARYDGLFVLRERRESEDDRRGVVVDGERRLRAGEAA